MNGLGCIASRSVDTEILRELNRRAQFSGAGQKRCMVKYAALVRASLSSRNIVAPFRDQAF
jgi:hypothetical protein